MQLQTLKMQSLVLKHAWRKGKQKERVVTVHGGMHTEATAVHVPLSRALASIYQCVCN